MQIINYISIIAVPFIIFIIILYGFLERIKIFDIFIEGTKEGFKTTIKILPTLIGLFFLVGAIRSSGIVEGMGIMLNPLLKTIKFPMELLPLALLRPVSGSASLATAMNIMETFGVDSDLGLMASVIMGATETTIYTIAVYSGYVKIKRTRFVLCAAVLADIAGIATAIVACRLLSMKSC